ncbi:hypothetical protein [Hufsiella ginkgonis]|uniref:Tetratricopeptide repeat protein n=1 Tax=Hufsiella ginkgonis TaxID=2695274 RepID=A0A7K1XU96_9SPHI|nr:hypothetical protein [Hufsiella ginkgonis]MXV14585.1 hypothetical protein [Hufsiella ginkgonis]
MKTLKFTFTLLMITMAATVFAQGGKYETAMQKALASLDSAETSAGFIGTANQFERISAVAAKEWLPAYYAAYSNLLAGLVTADNRQKDQLLDKALLEIGQAETLSPDNSEIWTVKGYVQFMKMSIDPMSRMALMSAANTSLEKAKTLDPANPRPWFVQGQNTFYTPEAFGGGKKAAKTMLENAGAKYAAVKTTAALMPAWGEKRCLTLLSQCK